MQWQDWVLSIGSCFFTIALIPSVIGRDKPAFSTSLSTGFVLIVFAAVYFTLALWIATFTTTLNAVVWLTLAYQKRVAKSSS